jgi:hypothetical protein
MGGSDRGRPTQDAEDILDRAEPTRSKPVLGSKPPFAGSSPDAAAKMAADAEALYNEATALEADAGGGTATASQALVRAYNGVVEALETPGVELPSDTAATIQFATTALAHAAAGKRGGELRTLATGLATRLRKLGYDSPDAAVDILASTSGEQRATTAIQAARARVDNLNMALDGAPPMARDALIAANATTIATLAREGALAKGASRPKQGDAAEAFAERVERLMEHCRRLGVDLEPSSLDLILRAADDVLEAAGIARKNLLADYYGKRTDAGITGAKGKDSEELGSTHVENVIAWMRDGGMASMVYADIRDIVNEPAVQREPSLFARLLTETVIAALGEMPKVLMKSLIGVVTKAPIAAAGAAAEGGKAVSPDVADLLSKAAKPAGPAEDGLRDLAAAVLPHVQDPIDGEIKAKVGEAVKAGLASTSKAPLSNVFLQGVQTGAVADTARRFAEANELRHKLEMLPPAEVQSVFQAMKDRTAAAAAANRTNLVMLWADFIVKATNGLDAAGTVNQLGGTIEQMGDTPGSVQIPVTVTVRPSVNLPMGGGATRAVPPHFHAGAVTMQGLSQKAIDELRAANLPLGSAKLHRIYQITLIDNGAGAVFTGRIDVNPAGIVDASSADPAMLAKIGSANPGVWNLAPEIVGADEPNAQEGVRQLLAMPVTTAEIQ